MLTDEDPPIQDLCAVEHDWEPYSFTTAAGSTPVHCVREGCTEVGYRIDSQVLAQDSGHKNEEGLF